MMDSELLKTLGQISGIGGLSLGILLLLFKEIIRKNIFPTLKKNDAYSIMKLIIISVWGIGFFGISGWIFLEYTGKSNQEYGEKTDKNPNINLSTKGNNSPIISDTKGNVELNFASESKNTE